MNSSDVFLVLRAHERGLSVVGILAMLVTFNLVYALVSTPAGSLSDRVGRRKLIIGGWLAYAAIYLGFALANVGWQEWSEFGKSDITISSQTTTSLTQDRNYNDTWHFAFGVQYRVTDPWLLSAGIAYDESPVDDDDRTPDLPLDRQIRYAVGAQYDWDDDISFGFAYEYLDAGDAKIDQFRGPLAGRLEGEYDTNEIHFLAFNVIWRF